MAMLARTDAQVIAGEAVRGTLQQRFQDMLNIASVAYNRAKMTDTTMSDVFSAPGQFNAYGQKMPAGTRSLVGLAQAAIDQVNKYGPVNKATYYATPSAVNNLPDGLNYETETAGHVYKSDPLNRAIITAQGTIVPDPTKLPDFQAKMVPTTQDIVTSPVDPAFAANGLLAGTPIASLGAPIASPTAENYAGTGLEGYAAVPSTLGNVPAEADAGASLGLDANARISSLIDNASPFERMGVPVSSFPSLAGAGPFSAPMDVNASLGGMKQPNLAASASVPMSASLFSPTMSTPTLNSFADLAAAKPMATPVDASVSAQLGLPSPMEASAVAQPNQSMPTVNSWSDVAAASPIQAPEASGINSPEMQAMRESVAEHLANMKSITASPTKNGYVDMANAGPMAIGVPADPNASLGVGAELAATGAATPVNNETPSQRMDIGPAGFDPNRFGDVTAKNFDPSRYGTPSALDQVMSTPTSYLDAPAIASTTPTPTTTTATPSLNSLVGPAADEAYANAQLASYNTPSVPAMASDSLLGAPASLQSVVNPTMVPGASIPSVNAPSLPSSTLDTPSIAADPNVSLTSPSLISSTPISNVTAPQVVDTTPAVTSQVTAPSLTSSLKAPNNSLTSTTSASPMHTAMDVWGGLATTGIATDGSTVSRLDDGTIGRYNPAYDHTEFTNPDGSYGGMKKGNVLGQTDPNASLSSPSISSTSSTTPGSSLNGGLSRLSNSIFSGGTLGALAGGLLGTALAGPIGGIALGMVGQKLGGNYLGDQVPDESPMHSLFGLLTGSPAPGATTTSSSTLGGGGGTYGSPSHGSTSPGGGGGVNGTSTGPGGGGGFSPGLF
jgi:hypothetical protein